ncbi:MAG: hypothetical protein KA746_07025 [Pyrinomonadaceae bacterium]|nr:hypothetical protein [Pyrinomonadaceae bacterium]
MLTSKTVLLLIFTACFSLSVSGQVTSVSQLKDVRPTDPFYADLQRLVEMYDVVGNDLIVAAMDTTPRPNALIGEAFYPKTPLSNRQFAFLFDDSLNRMRELIGTVTFPDGLDAATKYALMKDLRASINKKPISKLNITSYKQVKGLSLKFEEGIAVANLIDTHRVGVDLLSKDGTFDRLRKLSEKEAADILGNALSIKQICAKGKCTLGDLTIDQSTRPVTRGRFAQILNRYLNLFVEKIENLSSGK